MFFELLLDSTEAVFLQKFDNKNNTTPHGTAQFSNKNTTFSGITGKQSLLEQNQIYNKNNTAPHGTAQFSDKNTTISGITGKQ